MWTVKTLIRLGGVFTGRTWHSCCASRQNLLMPLSHMSHSMTKPIKWPVCPAKTQTWWVCAARSESSLSAWRNMDPYSYPVSAQWRLRSDCAGWSEYLLGTHHFVGFVVLRLICEQQRRRSVMSCGSINLLTLFLGRLRPHKLLYQW